MKIYKDNDIVKKLRHGDRRSQNPLLTQIYKDNYRIIENYILNNSGNTDEAQDIFQDGIIVFYNHCKNHDFELKATLRTYLFAICRNLWLSKLTRENRNLKLNDAAQFDRLDNSELEGRERSEKNRVLAKFLDRLGGNCQKILGLFYFERYPMTSIARNMGLANKDVAKSKKYKCLQRLKSMVNSSGYASAFFK